MPWHSVTFDNFLYVRFVTVTCDALVDGDGKDGDVRAIAKGFREKMQKRGGILSAGEGYTYRIAVLHPTVFAYLPFYPGLNALGEVFTAEVHS